MSELRGRALSLVEAARADAPTEADRARVRAALAARLGAVPVPDATATGAAAKVGIVAKVLAAGAVLGAVAFGAGVVAGKASAHPVDLARHGAEAQALRRVRAIDRAADRGATPPAPVVAKIEVAPPISIATAMPAPSARAITPPVVIAPPITMEGPPRPPERMAPPASKASSLMEETKLLAEAQTALGRGEAQAALAKLDELGARHPDGLLREERLAARILALCAAGREAEARREAEGFLVEMRGSIQAGRVRTSCAFAKKDERGSP